MKKIKIITILLFVSISAFAQVKKDNLITLTTTEESQAIYTQILKTLIIEGYDIASKDNDILQIKTDAKKIKGIESTMTITIMDNKILIKGKFKLLGDEERTTFRGMKGSPYMLAWEDLDTFARKIPHKTITYSKQ